MEYRQKRIKTLQANFLKFANIAFFSEINRIKAIFLHFLQHNDKQKRAATAISAKKQATSMWLVCAKLSLRTVEKAFLLIIGKRRVSAAFDFFENFIHIILFFAFTSIVFVIGRVFGIPARAFELHFRFTS